MLFRSEQEVSSCLCEMSLRGCAVIGEVVARYRAASPEREVANMVAV